MLGWTGSLLLALCGLPQAFKSWKTGHARDVSLTFLLMWLAGEILCVTATLIELGLVKWLIVNYILNIVFVLTILYYKVNPRSYYSVD